ncbi:MAG: M1 family metallopeptidase [Acidobacteriota bacterium]|jgi:aminopeptidase N
MKARIAVVVAALLVLIGASASAPADSYPKNFDIDVLHYTFELQLSDATDHIEGVTTVQIRFQVAGVEEFALDLTGEMQRETEGGGSETVGMVVGVVEELHGEEDLSGAVAAEPVPLHHVHADDRLLIELDRPSVVGEVRRFRIRYGGVPATGLIIGDNKYGDRTFFSDNWPDRARNWLPTIDHPYEKATSEMVVTAPTRYQVVSNGLLAEETDLMGDELDAVRTATGMPVADFRRTRWRQSVPIAPWLFVLGAAPFAVETWYTLDGVPLQTWVYRQDRDAGFYDFSWPTREVLQYYSDAIGPYAYEKLANVQSNSVGGGMEAATAIFYGDDSVTGERTVRWRNVIIHEIAHQWWGNAVTENDWDHVWLSEGFATYFTLLFREHAYGRDDFVEGLLSSRRSVLEFYADNPDYRVVHDDLDPIGRSTVTNGMTYQRGSWFLHMLRGLMGDDRFWSGIREYYRLYRNGNASTDDFREVMENAFEPAVDLTLFFDQWLYQGGIPQLRGSWWWDDDASELVIELTQIEDDGYTFEMPIPVRIDVPANPSAGGGRRGGRGSGPQVLDRKVMMPRTSAQTRIALPRAPSAVTLDPDLWVLMEVTEFGRR